MSAPDRGRARRHRRQERQERRDRRGRRRQERQDRRERRRHRATRDATSGDPSGGDRKGRQQRQERRDARRRRRDVAQQRRRAVLDGAVTDVVRHPGRSALTVLGLALAAGTLVGMLGLTETAAAQLDDSRSLRAATEVTVRDVTNRRGGPPPAGTQGGQGGQGSAAGRPGRRPIRFPSDATERVARVDGVVHAGVHWRVPLGDQAVAGGPASAPATGDGQDLDAFAVAPGALAAMGADLRAGIRYDAAHAERRARVAVLGDAAARQLGITTLATRPAIFLGTDAYTVVGIVDDAERPAGMLAGVMIPQTVALERYGPPAPDAPATMLIETELGAAPLVADRAALALRPDAPGGFEVTTPLDGRAPRPDRGTAVDALHLLLTAVAVAAGALGIAGTTLATVHERATAGDDHQVTTRRTTHERPTTDAGHHVMATPRRHVVARHLASAGLLGALGGLTGTGLGVLTVIVVAVARQWSAELDPRYVLLAPVAGGLIGLVAGFCPALRAAGPAPVRIPRR